MGNTLFETDDARANRQTQYAFAPGDIFEGALDDGEDIDWLGIDLEKGAVYRFVVEGIGEDPLRDFDLEIKTGRNSFLIFDQTELTFDPDDFLTSQVTATFTAPSGRTFFLETSMFFDDINAGDYRITALALPREEDDVGADPETAGQLVLGAPLTAALDDAEDEDWFALELEAGINTTFSVTGLGLTDPVLSLYDATGAEIARVDDLNDDFSPSLDPRFTYAVAESGTYFLGVDGATPFDSGSYQVSARSGQTQGTAAPDRIQATPDLDFISGGAGDDTLLGSTARDSLSGEAGNDLIRGGRRSDFLQGGDGDDTLLGQGGRDNLMGGLGNDVLRGGTFDDRLEASAGRDIMVGGRGADVFEFRAPFGTTVIRDFDPTQDRLEISGFDLGLDGLSKTQIFDRHLSFDDGDAILALKFGTILLRGAGDRLALGEAIDLF